MYTIDPASDERGPEKTYVKTGENRTGHDKQDVRQGDTSYHHRVSRVLVYSMSGAVAALVLIAVWFTS